MITVSACESVAGAPSGLVRVCLADDAFPDLEGELHLAPGGAWMRGHVMEVVSFTLRTRPETSDPERINSSLLKSVPFGRWIAVAVGVASDFVDGGDVTFWSIPNPAETKPTIRQTDAGPDYGAVAMLYRIYLRTSERSPAEEIANDFNASTQQAQQWIARARYMGFLGPIAPRKRRRSRWAIEQEGGGKV